MALFGKRKERRGSPNTDKTLVNEPITKSQIKQATRTRMNIALFTSFCLLVSVVFLIIVEVACTSTHNALTNVYFIRLNVANVVPTSFANAALLNTIAQSLGLHDYYQVGLWNYCEGYVSSGTTACSPTQTLYWFNPVEIIRNQLIAGASINLPEDLDKVLDIIHLASNVMFGLFLAGACVAFVLIFLLPLAVYSRWVSFVLTIFTFLDALCITAASIVATVLFIIMRNVFRSNTEVNIGAKIGTTMFACMWVASAFSIFAFLFQFGMCCCCASRRDVKTGRKGRKKIDSATIEK